MMRTRAWMMAALLVACADVEADVRGPGLDVTMDEDEGPPLDVPGEDIPVSGEAPSCPPLWTLVYMGNVPTCVPQPDPPGVPQMPDEPGGSGGPGGSVPDDPGDDDGEEEDDRGTERFRARMRQRNNACIANCIAEAVAPAVDCRTYDGFTRPAGQECPFGSRLDDADFCPGFWELCVYNRLRPFGEPPDVDVCFDAHGEFVRDAPGCQVEVQSCIASWEQYYNPFDWLSCIQDHDSAMGCAISCFEQFPVDGSACFGSLDGSSIEGTMDGTRCETSSGVFVECAAIGQTSCSY